MFLNLGDYARTLSFDILSFLSSEKFGTKFQPRYSYKLYSYKKAVRMKRGMVAHTSF